jgi:hypothetical protein
MSETYIHFVLPKPSASSKTTIWQVVSMNDDTLGEVRWYAQWRRYGFYPDGDGSVFDANCLQALSDFCSERTREHKENRGITVANLKPSDRYKLR